MMYIVLFDKNKGDMHITQQCNQFMPHFPSSIPVIQLYFITAACIIAISTKKLKCCTRLKIKFQETSLFFRSGHFKHFLCFFVGHTRQLLIPCSLLKLYRSLNFYSLLHTIPTDFHCYDSTIV